MANTHLTEFLQNKPAVTTTDQEEVCLILIALVACARGTDDADRPFLKLIRNNPNPNTAVAANPQEVGALALLKRIYNVPAGSKIYTRINSGIGDQELKDLQGALGEAMVALSGAQDIWDLDPPHPRGTSLGTVSF